MIGPDRHDRAAALASVPEQIAAYAAAVSGAAPRMVGACIGYLAAGRLLLVAYPLHDPLDRQAMAAAVAEALRLPGLDEIAVIGPERPPQAPPQIPAREDRYFALSLPPPRPKAKLRSLLKRAARELEVETGRRCGAEHSALIAAAQARGDLDPATRRIFQEIPRYLAASAGSRVVSARRRDGGALAAFAVGEFAALETAFYMFAFRDPALAPPGASDLVLAELIAEAERRGHSRINLGLGVSPGVEFFKRKWGARPFLPYVEVAWRRADAGRGGAGWLARLRGGRRDAA